MLTEAQKKARNERVNKWNSENRERRRAIALRHYHKKGYVSTPKKIAQCKRYYHAHREEQLEKQRAKIKVILEKRKERKRRNPEKIRAQEASYRRQPKRKLANNLRCRIYVALKGIAKSKRTLALLGCSIEELKVHIQKQFKPGMNWNNYGAWHVDHIKPCAKFNLFDPEQQAACFHYSNLQPLWASENIRKGAKYGQAG